MINTIKKATSFLSLSLGTVFTVSFIIVIGASFQKIVLGENFESEDKFIIIVMLVILFLISVGYISIGLNLSKSIRIKSSIYIALCATLLIAGLLFISLSYLLELGYYHNHFVFNIFNAILFSLGIGHIALLVFYLLPKYKNNLLQK